MKNFAPLTDASTNVAPEQIDIRKVGQTATLSQVFKRVWYG